MGDWSELESAHGAIRACRPVQPTHGFNCVARHDFDPQSAALAWQRTTACFDEALR